VAGDAARLAHDHHLVAIEEGDGIAMQLVGSTAVVLEITSGGGDVAARQLHRLAGIGCLDLGELFLVGKDRAAEFRQQATALGRRRVAPYALECDACRGHCCIDVLAVAAGDRADNAAVAGTYHVD
jgi:hypothetical protein